MNVLAPLDGWCALLTEVPDDVFAQGMVGDGLAIDPTSGNVLAPCDGEVVMVPDTGHAVAVRTAQGTEVLIHIGIDSVKLGGSGFESLVRKGQRVRAGDLLIRFDLDVVARGARSVMTPIIVTLAEGSRIVRRHPTGRIRAGDVLLELTPVAESSATRSITIPLRDGLHARPAALIAKRARASSAKVILEAHGKAADARSVTAIMGLGVRNREVVVIRADTASALDAVVAAIDEALRLESKHTEAPQGVIAVRGFATGRAARLERTEVSVTEAGQGRAREVAELTRAQGIVRTELSRTSGGSTQRQIAEAHAAFLDDPELNEAAQASIAEGKSAGFAWRAATRQAIASLQATGDVRLRERIDDLLDIESQLLLALSGDARPAHIPLPEDAVVVADELLPSQLLALDRANLRAICLTGGGATSHVAILAAAFDVPMLVGLGTQLQGIRGGEQLIVDAEEGVLHVSPSAAAFAQAEQRSQALQMQRVADRDAAQQLCRTRDGTRVEIFSNLGSVPEAEAAVAAGAEGCGLLRTEFLFIDREQAPDEAEQLSVYQRIADALKGRPLILRLMDIGGDKPLRYLPLPQEENPALGLRGIRTALRHPALLATQLRAASRIAPDGIVRILVPMVTDVAEIQTVRDALAEVGPQARIEIGAMIETPAAALTADRIAAASDFLSIGSNDLTQYALAMDRGHPELARRIDALHPAVLRLISIAASAGTRSGKTVAVCGGIAADPAAVPLLIGYGVRELSVVPSVIAPLKRQVRELDVEECAALAARALELESAAHVRALVRGGAR